MPAVKSLDLFLERSLNLLLTNPTETRISITYGSLSKKEVKASKVTKPESNKSFVSFKVYEPKSGSLYKFKTTKSKDFSKILTALGPHGVQLSHGDEIQKSTKGFSSVLANAEVPEYEEEKGISAETEKQGQQHSQQQASAGVSKKAKKKKGKK